MFAKVENGVTIVPFFSPEKQEKRSLFIWPVFFSFYEQDRLLCARVDIGVTESPTKIAKKDEKNGSEILFSKVGVRNPVFSGEFSCFWPRKN